MKTIFFLFAMMLFSINLYSAPPDSCLWAPENPIQPIFTDDDWHNRTPTILIDTCGLSDINPNYYREFPNSPDTSGSYYVGLPNINSYKDYLAQKRFYSKSLWGIKMSWTVFDTIGKDLNTLNYFTVDDIDENNNQEIFQAFQQVSQTYGDIKFWFRFDKNISVQDAWNFFDNNGDSEYIRGEYVYIECETFVNSAEFAEFVNTNAPNLECEYRTFFSLPLSVEENSITKFTIILSADYNSIYIKSDDVIQQVTVFSLTGNKLATISDANSNNEIQINISYLQTGIYFVQVNRSIHKFIVVR